MAANRLSNGQAHAAPTIAQDDAGRPTTVPVPTTGAANVSKLCAALYQLTQHADCPRWVQAAAVELCRDHHVTMMAVA